MAMQKDSPDEYPIILVTDIDKSYYGKFLRNHEKMQELAAANPNSYAATIVRSVDHYVMGRALLEDYKKRSDASLIPSILKEFSDSLLESELFILWGSDVLRYLGEMADKVMAIERDKVSQADHNARVCMAMIKSQGDLTTAINFLESCKEKYKKEVFFHRIYCDLFLFTTNTKMGLRACEEIALIFPKNANVLHTKACAMRMLSDTGQSDYDDWAIEKRKIEMAKEAYKAYLKVAPNDHRHYAENNYVMAYLALKYATSIPDMTDYDIREFSYFFQNGLNAETEVLPCFSPFYSETKEFIIGNIKMHPSLPTPILTFAHTSTCCADAPSPRSIFRQKIKITDVTSPIDSRKRTKRKMDVLAAHRLVLKNFLALPAMVWDVPDAENHAVSFLSINNDSDNFEEIRLYQMALSRMSNVFVSKIIRLTVVDDPLFSYRSGFLETVASDVNRDLISFKIYLGTTKPEYEVVKRNMKTFGFGSVWNLKNPDIVVDMEDDRSMYIRAVSENLIPVQEDQKGSKCRACFKWVTTPQRCSKCKKAIYCGKECQRIDWKYFKHNLICSEMYNSLSSPLCNI